MRRILSFIFCLLLQNCNNHASLISDPEIVGRGVISTELPEFATTVNSNQDLIFFNRTAEDRTTMRIMYARLESGQWTDADTLPFSTGRYRDVDPFLTADGKRLYFSSDRPVGGLSSKSGVFNTWYVEWRGDSWSEPINPGYPLNSDSTEIFVSLAYSGNAYFVSERDGSRGIMVSEFTNGRYQDATDIVLKLRGEVIYASNPCISSDERFLIVAASDPLGNQAPDLFISWNENGTWSELINLGEAINSSYADFGPGLSKDNQVLYFTSERPGIVPAQGDGMRPPGDIYQVNIVAVLASLRK